MNEQFICFHNYEDRIVYIPVLLNIFYNEPKYAFTAKDDIEFEDIYFSNGIKNLISNDNVNIIIIDFKGVKEKRIVESFCKCKKIIFINIDNRNIWDPIFKNLFDIDEAKKKGTHDKLTEQTTWVENIVADKDRKVIYNSHFQTEFERLMSGKTIKDISEIVQDIIDLEISKIVHISLEDPQDNKEIYLTSSNVYANKYVQIKNIFLNPHNLLIIAFYLAEYIFNELKEVNDIKLPVCLISASTTGAVLANIVRKILSKMANVTREIIGKNIHMLHLGPKFMKVDSNVDKRAFENKNFVFIFDFMCLGAEQKTVKTLVGNNKGNLIKSIGVASYQIPRDKSGKSVKDIITLCDIKKWTTNKYKVAFERGSD